MHEVDGVPVALRSALAPRAKRGFAKVAAHIIPLPLLRAVWLELQTAVVRWRSRRLPERYRGAHDLLVNLGAGTAGRTGWVNVDAFAFPGVNCIWDCRRVLPFPDESVRGVFTEHFLEHIDYDEDVPQFLSECMRVLQREGVIRIVVPDVEKYLRAYFEDGWTTLSTLRPLLGPEREDYWTWRRYATKMEFINYIFRQGMEHKFSYDYETLKYILERAGFSKVRQQSFGNSLLPELAIDRPDRASESLYVEAVKV